MDSDKKNQTRKISKIIIIVLAILAFVITSLIVGNILYQKHLKELEKQRVTAAIDKSYNICEDIENGNIKSAIDSIKLLSDDEFKIGQPILNECFCCVALNNVNYKNVFITDRKDLQKAGAEIKVIKTYMDLGNLLDKNKKNRDIQSVMSILIDTNAFHDTYSDDLYVFDQELSNDVDKLTREINSIVKRIGRLDPDYVYLVRSDLESG